MATIYRGLPDLRVQQVEVVFPGCTVSGFLPVGGDCIVISTELALKALRKAGCISPQLPDAITQAHLVHARDTPLIVVERVIRLVHIIGTDDPRARAEMFDNERPSLQPCKRHLSAHCAGWIGREDEFDIPRDDKPD